MEQIILEYNNYQEYYVPSVRWKRPLSFTYCPMCRQQLDKKNTPHTKFYEELDGVLIPSVNYTELSTCKACGWWGLRENGEYFEVSAGWDILASGIVRKWDVSSLELPIEALISHYKKSRTIDLKVLDPMVFEKLIA